MIFYGARESNIPPAVFNIATYGAVIDSVTDDTAAVQAAANAAIANGGGIVYNPGNNGHACMISGVYGASNIEWRGNGPVNSGVTSPSIYRLLPSVSQSGTYEILRISSASLVQANDVKVNGLTIDGNKNAFGANSNIKVYGFYCSASDATDSVQVTRVTIHNSEFTNCHSYAVDVLGVNNMLITDSSSHDNGFVSGSGTHINCDGWTLFGNNIMCCGVTADNNAQRGFLPGQDANPWFGCYLNNCEASGNHGPGVLCASANSTYQELYITGGSYTGNNGGGDIVIGNGASAIDITDLVAGSINLEAGSSGVYVTRPYGAAITNNGTNNVITRSGGQLGTQSYYNDGIYPWLNYAWPNPSTAQ
jgi:hypothetical protein